MQQGLQEMEIKICDKYSKPDEKGLIRCGECPLNRSKDIDDIHCKANSHYNRSTRQWEYDLEESTNGI